MSGDRHPIWPLLDQMQMDLRQLSARMVELRAKVAGLELQTAPLPRCPECGVAASSMVQLEEHRYHHHDGPLPAAWSKADSLVDERSAA